MMFNERISPFNECFYYNCFHSALFAVIKANHGSVLECMASGVPHLERQTIDDKFRILYRFNFMKSYSELMGENGLECSFLAKEDESISHIRSAILDGAAAIINVEGWALPYRADLFHKSYWPHCILVTGYKSDLGLFTVIDQPTRDSVASQFFEIPEGCLNDAIKLYCERKHNFVEYAANNNWLVYPVGNVVRDRKPSELFALWRLNLSHEKNLIIEGIANARRSLPDIIELLKRLDGCNHVEGHFFLDGLNDIVKQHRWMGYFVREVSVVDNELIKLINNLLLQWEQVRNCIGHIIFSGRKRDSTLELVGKKWCIALNMESEILTKLFV